MEDALASVWQRARLWDASCRALADSGAGSAPLDRPAADNRAQGGPEETKPSAAAGGDKPPPLHVENGDFYSAPFPVEAPGDGAPVPFRHVFSALWHWSSGVIVAQRRLSFAASPESGKNGAAGGCARGNIASTSSTSSNATAASTEKRMIVLDLRRYNFNNNPPSEWARSREDHN